MRRPLELPSEVMSGPPDAVAVYGLALRALGSAGAPFLVGGAWAMAHLAGVCRNTKDLDLFVRPQDLDRVLHALAAVGFRTEILSRTWLGKAWYDALFLDIIFSSGNGIATVDGAWFDHALPGVLLDVPVSFCPVEETIWSKAWIMERERFDGADVAHLLRARGPQLDWPRLLDRFGPHWRVLLGHLVLFGYIYPSERDRIPPWVMAELGGRLTAELGASPGADRLCRGPLLSRQQYTCDLDRWGYTGPITDGDTLTQALDDATEPRPARRRG